MLTGHLCIFWGKSVQILHGFLLGGLLIELQEFFIHSNSPLSNTCIGNIFSQCVACLFYFSDKIGCIQGGMAVDSFFIFLNGILQRVKGFDVDEFQFINN